MSDPTQLTGVSSGESQGSGDSPATVADGAGTTALAGAAPPRRRRGRNSAVGALVVLTTLMVLITTVGLWAFRQVYNTNVFVGHVDAAISNPNVQASLSNYLTDQVMTAINPEQRARAALPPQADPLIGPVVSAIRGFVNQAVDKVISSDQFHTLVHNATRRAHTAAIDLLEGKKVAGLTLNGNEVVFNTLPMIDQVLQQLSQQGGLLGNLKVPPLATPDGQPSGQAQELASKLGVTLPPDFGQLVVFKSDSLHSAQQALRLIKRLLLLAIVATVVLIAATLLLSLHRLRTLAELGVGVAVAMLVAWAVTQRIVSDIVAQVGTDAGRKSVRAVVGDFLSSLRAIIIVLVVIAVVVILVAFLFGQSRSAAWVRTRFKGLARPAEAGRRAGALTRAAAFVADHRDGLLVVGAGVGLLILLIGGLSWPTAIAAVVVVALWEAAVWYAGRSASGPEGGTGVEPPEASSGPPADTAPAVQ